MMTSALDGEHLGRAFRAFRVPTYPCVTPCDARLLSPTTLKVWCAWVSALVFACVCVCPCVFARAVYIVKICIFIF